MNFSVKRDFSPIFITNAVLVFLVVLFFFFSLASTWMFSIFIAIALIALLFYDLSVTFASCELNKSILTFRTGFLGYKIDLTQATDVSLSKNFYPSLALSYDRVRIVLKGKNNKEKIYYVAVDDNNKLLKVISNIIERNSKEVQVSEVIASTGEDAKIEKENKIEENIEEKKTQDLATKPIKKQTKTTTKKPTAKKKTTTKKTTSSSKKTTTKKTSKEKSTKINEENDK